DLWPAIFDDLVKRVDERNTWLGHTSGDADYHVAQVFPLIAMPGHDGFYASTHNVLLEFVVADGLIILPLMAWAVFVIVRGVRLSEPSGAIAVAMGIVSLTNVSIYDLAGGSAAFGLMMAVVGRGKSCMRPVVS